MQMEVKLTRTSKGNLEIGGVGAVNVFLWPTKLNVCVTTIGNSQCFYSWTADEIVNVLCITNDNVLQICKSM